MPRLKTRRHWPIAVFIIAASIWLFQAPAPEDAQDHRGAPSVLEPGFNPAMNALRPHPLSCAGPAWQCALGGDDGNNDDDDAPPEEGPKTHEELKQRIEEILLATRVPGVGIALVDRGGIRWSDGVGVANRHTGVAVDGDTVFRSGSVSKTVIALAVMTLVEDGLVRLDAPISQLAPDVALDNPWSDTDPVTLAHVLEHTAGFDDMRFNETFITPDQSEPSLADALAVNPRSRASRWRPGSRYAYSNPGYTVAAHVVERVTGMPFERYVEARLLRPIGMRTASFTLTDELRARLAQGYDGLSNQRALPVQRLVHRPAGELMTSTRELAELVRLFLNRGTHAGNSLISDDSLRRMERGQTRSFPELSGNYGLGIYGDVTLPVPGRGHNGGLPGFASEYRYFDELGLGYVMLLNATGGDVGDAYWQIRDLIFAFMTRGMTLPEPPTIEVPEDQLAMYVGAYELASPRHELLAFVDRVLQSAEVSLLEGQLSIQLGNGALLPLVPTAHGHFRTPWTSDAFVSFARLSDGTRVLSIADTYYEEGDGGHIANRRLALGLALRLIDIGFFWNIIWLPGWLILVIRFRQYFPLPRDAVPALSCACFLVMQKSFIAGTSTGALGYIGFMSLTFFVASLLFPLLSLLALYGAIRGLRRDVFEDASLDELVESAGFITQIYSDDWRHRLYQLATGIACVGLSVYLTYHGIIGLRTWTW